MGLGSLELVSLAQARELAAEARKLARSGIDPIEARRLERRQARKDDARAMSFDECAAAYFDLDPGLWTLPAARMKAGREHRVPLIGRALVIVQELAAVPLGPFVFPAPTHEHKPLSDMAFKALLKRMKKGAYVPHGFRSTLRDWRPNAPRFHTKSASRPSPTRSLTLWNEPTAAAICSKSGGS